MNGIAPQSTQRLSGEYLEAIKLSTWRLAREAFVICWLFTESDLKTIFLPVLVFSAVVAPITSLDRLLHTAVWTWVHLLHTDVSNQASGEDEDATNKPWRPIPSGRITLDRARELKRLLLFATVALSWRYGVVGPSLGLSLALLLHDDVGFHKHWLLKNLCNLCGYMSFELGATMVARGSTAVDKDVIVALTTSNLIVFTTIHAQDFADVEGDSKRGRRTVPIVAPKASRVLMPILLLGWSLLLCHFWGAGFVTGGGFCALGAAVGIRFMAMKTIDDDKRTYIYYNIWLMFAYCFPILSRYPNLAI